MPSSSSRNSTSASLLDGPASPSSINTDPLTHIMGDEPLSDLLLHNIAGHDHDHHSALLSSSYPNTAPIIANAVHMEIQDNAKLPTFNLAVDRSNSVGGANKTSSNHHHHPDTNRDIDEMMRLSEHDFNLTEMFLESDDRSSRNLNYSSAAAGAAMIGNEVDHADKGNNPAAGTLSGQAEPSTLDASMPSDAVSTTGATETKAASFPSPSLTSVAATPNSLAVSHSHMLNYYRSEPLPIPSSPTRVTITSGESLPPTTAATKPDSPTTKPASPSSTKAVTKSDAATMAAAVATAAAIALTRRRSSKGCAQVNNVSSHSSSPKTSTQSDSSTEKSSTQPKERSTNNKPTTTTTTTTTAPTILEATKRRAQFGFGDNHVVPSVPQPPPPSSSKAALPPLCLPPSAGNSQVAYERKKQRAKDARVKLNDAIDALSIAISVAGTQSKQRLAEWQGLFLLGQQQQNENGNQTMQIIQDCIDTAESAKKWKRPGFVETAATLVQDLNAQCEALMRELVATREELARKSSGGDCINTIKGSTAEPGAATTTKVKLAPGLNGVNHAALSGVAMHKRAAANAAVSDLSPTKRPKTEVESLVNGESSHLPANAGQESAVKQALSNESIVRQTACFLDPISLLRCRQVSRNTKNVLDKSADSIWLDRCRQRFGPVQVEQWKKRENNMESSPSSSLLLYAQMDAANVQPDSQQEGSLLLGQGRIPGKVSAWVTMVERSNGETCRSVKREAADGYASLPVVELRYLIQNTGSSSAPIDIRQQVFGVDASTRRRGQELKEVTWDERLTRTWLQLDGSTVQQQPVLQDEWSTCRLGLYESVILVVHIHAKGCSTTAKFQQRANFTKILTSVNGTTVPLVVPFIRGEPASSS